uniref:Uncharacterized protein n=1 Tax=viral metagenome TaxID=1070528 RepID=A0A6C0JF94_9ZZZZ
MGIMKLMLVWFIVNICLGFLLFASFIIPGVNFVAGPITFVLVSLVNLVFFIMWIVKVFKKMGNMGGSEQFLGGNYIKEDFDCSANHDEKEDFTSYQDKQS